MYSISIHLLGLLCPFSLFLFRSDRQCNSVTLYLCTNCSFVPVVPVYLCTCETLYPCTSIPVYPKDLRHAIFDKRHPDTYNCVMVAMMRKMIFLKETSSSATKNLVADMYIGVERNGNQVFVSEQDFLSMSFKFRFRHNRCRIYGRKICNSLN